MEENKVTLTEPLKRKNSAITILVTVLISGILFGEIGYFLRDLNERKIDTSNIFQGVEKNNEIKEVEKSGELEIVKEVPTSICVSEKDNIITLVNNFEKLQMEQNADGVLALFTPAVSVDDVNDYKYLIGKDTNVPVRLYSTSSVRYITEKFTILSDPKEQGKNCIVEVEEMRSMYGGPDNPTFLSATNLKFQLEAKKVGNVWKVETYNSLEPKIKDGKYSGFLMIYK